MIKVYFQRNQISKNISLPIIIQQMIDRYCVEPCEVRSTITHRKQKNQKKNEYEPSYQKWIPSTKHGWGR